MTPRFLIFDFFFLLVVFFNTAKEDQRCENARKHWYLFHEREQDEPLISRQPGKQKCAKGLF